MSGRGCKSDENMQLMKTDEIKRKYGGSEEHMKKLEEYVVSIPDFPEPGIIFRDVTSILQDGCHITENNPRLRKIRDTYYILFQLLHMLF